MELTRYYSDVKLAQVSGKMMEYVKFSGIVEGFNRGKLVQSHSISVTKQKYKQAASSFSRGEVSPEEARILG